MMKPLLTIDEAAKLLNASKSTVRKLINTNHIHSIDISDNPQRRTIRIRPEWVEEFIDKRTIRKPEAVTEDREKFKVKFF